MEEQPHEAIDDLLRQIRLKLLQIRESDTEIAEEVKSLLTQLEDWIEKLVIDSLKLQSLEKRPKKTTESADKHKRTPRGKKAQ